MNISVYLRMHDIVFIPCYSLFLSMTISISYRLFNLVQINWMHNKSINQSKKAVIVLWCFQKIPRILADLGMASHIVAVVNPGRSGLRECTLLCTDQNFHSKYTNFFFYIFVYMIHFRPLKNLNGTSVQCPCSCLWYCATNIWNLV